MWYTAFRGLRLIPWSLHFLTCLIWLTNCGRMTALGQSELLSINPLSKQMQKLVPFELAATYREKGSDKSSGGKFFTSFSQRKLEPKYNSFISIISQYYVCNLMKITFMVVHTSLTLYFFSLFSHKYFCYPDMIGYVIMFILYFKCIRGAINLPACRWLKYG